MCSSGVGNCVIETKTFRGIKFIKKLLGINFKKALTNDNTYWIHIPPHKTKRRVCEITKELYSELRAIKTGIYF